MKKAVVIFSVMLGIAGVGGVLFLANLGMFRKMTVEEKAMGPYTMVYESFIGPYSETKAVFDKVYQAVQAKGIETTQGLGVYYDNPSKVAKDKLRSDCGVVIQDKDKDKINPLPEPLQVKTLESKPSLVTVFPIRSPLSYMLGPIKAYPALMQAAEKRQYTVTGTYELYDEPNKTIYFVATFAQAEIMK